MNTFLGNAAGAHNTWGHENVFIGGRAGTANVDGFSNVIVGAYAGDANTTGDRNVFMGNCSGYSNTEGNKNTFVGYQAGIEMVNGSNNVAVGYLAGENNNGNNNVFLGCETGFENYTGSGNVLIGYRAGSGWAEGQSNKLCIDNKLTTRPLIYGDFSTNFLKIYGKVGIGVWDMLANHLLDIGEDGAYCNGGAWVDGSSRDFKENIEELTAGEALRAFADLEPVKFNYKKDKEETYLGFIAEDVPELVATKDRKGLSPMDMVAMLTKVVQEQQKAISKLEDKIAQLEKKGLEEE